MAEGKWKRIVKLRVMTDARQVEEIGQTLAKALEQSGYEVLEVSGVFPCREPNEHEGRVYVTFR